MIKLPTYVQKAINLLEDAGFEAYAVGGCVRDYCLSGEPHDWDITTSASPDQMTNIFSAFKVIPTGIKHGTITVGVDGKFLEITTFRIDGDYFDNRRPEKVEYTKDLKEDLKRRDFTINAMAYNETRGLVDLFNGRHDIETKMIRCVGDADKRFFEDALRIMRALRFSATLGFTIDHDTHMAIMKNKSLLRRISAERISSELSKLLVGKNAAAVLLKYKDVFAEIIPELTPTLRFEQKNKHHIYTVYDHMAHAVGDAVPDLEVRLALFLHDIGKPETFHVDERGVGHFYGHSVKSADITERVLRKLKFSGDVIETVTRLVEYHDYLIHPNMKSVKHAMRRFGVPFMRKLIEVKRADSKAHNPAFAHKGERVDDIQALMDEALKENQCFTLDAMAINGQDVLALGVEPGPKVGKILDGILNEIVDGGLENDREKLLERLGQVLAQGETDEESEG